MKKIIAAVIALDIFFALCSCGESEVSQEEYRSEDVVTTEQQTTAPKYNTLGISVEEAIEKYNNSGDFTVTFSSDCLTEDLGDGRTSFETVNDIQGTYWSGTYETATKEIIDITVSYPCGSSDYNSSAPLACIITSFAMEYILDIDNETAMDKFMTASSDSSKPIYYNGCSIQIGYDATKNAITTIMKADNEL